MVERRSQYEKQPVDIKLARDVSNYLNSLYDRLSETNGGSNPQIDVILKRAKWEAGAIIRRDNTINRTLYSNEYEEIMEREVQLKGPAKIGRIGCLDGRRYLLQVGRSVSEWKNPAGVIGVTKRLSDGKLIPASPILTEGINHQVEDDTEFLEIVEYHTDSTNPNHGCAAINLYTNEMDAGTSPFYKTLGPVKVAEVVEQDKPEEANLLLLESTTSEAFTNYFNSCREQQKQKPLKRVTLPVMYDTATMGITIKPPEKTLRATDVEEVLSSTTLVNRYKNDIEKTSKDEVGTFGSYRVDFNNPSEILQFAQDQAKLEEKLLDANFPLEEGENPYFKRVDFYLRAHYGDLTEAQRQAARFYITKIAAFQYLTGFSELEKGVARHPFAIHGENYMAVSTGEFLGHFDTEQMFGSSAADPDAAIEQISIKLRVMGAGEKRGDPKILFVCQPADRQDFEQRNKGLLRSRQAEVELFNKIINNPDFSKQIKAGYLIPIPVIIDDNSREVLEVPNLARYI